MESQPQLEQKLVGQKQLKIIRGEIAQRTMDPEINKPVHIIKKQGFKLVQRSEDPT